MHALRNRKQSPRSRGEAAVDGLVVAGLTELALGALTGWPMAHRRQPTARTPKTRHPSAAHGCGNGTWT